MGYLEIGNRKIDMGISDAMRCLEKNIRVKRCAWGKYTYLILVEEPMRILFCDLENEILREWFPSLNDLFAKDWEVVGA